MTLTEEHSKILLIQMVYRIESQCVMELEVPTDPGGDFSMESEPDEQERVTDTDYSEINISQRKGSLISLSSQNRTIS